MENSLTFRDNYIYKVKLGERLKKIKGKGLFDSRSNKRDNEVPVRALKVTCFRDYRHKVQVFCEISMFNNRQVDNSHPFVSVNIYPHRMLQLFLGRLFASVAIAALVTLRAHLNQL